MLKLPKQRLTQKAKSRIVKEVMMWALFLPAGFAVVFTAASFWLYPAKPALASPSPLGASGIVFYGDTTNAGIMRDRIFTSTATWAAEVSGITGSASAIEHVVAKSALTREEFMIGSLRINGTLQIETCTAACDATGDFTNQWAATFVSAAQDCDTAPTLGTCTRPFDINYMGLSGKAMVAYAGDSDANSAPDSDSVYYAIWDGSSWSPDSSPNTPSATNKLNLPGSAGTPRWVRVLSSHDTENGSYAVDADYMMILVDDSNSDLHAFFWNGSSFDSGTTLETAMENDDRGQSFDGQCNPYTCVVVYEDTAANTVRYNTYTITTSAWAGEANVMNVAAAGYWLTYGGSLVVDNNSGSDTNGAYTDAGTWLACTTGSCPDISTETVSGDQASAATGRLDTTPGIHVYNDAGTSMSSASYMKLTFNVGTDRWDWGTAAGLGFTATSDDAAKIKAWGSPVLDDDMIIAEDVDCNMFAVQYNGATLDAVNNNLETDLSDVPATCNQTSPNAGTGAGYPYDFAYKSTELWQRNWQFFDGADTASSPTTSLAAENTTPTGYDIEAGGKIRLRINYAERQRAISDNDSRKFLQYTSGCNPNTAWEESCTWHTVLNSGDTTVAWRYADVTCTPTDCADNTVLTATKLTGSSTCSAGLGCGTWVENWSASATNMDVTAQSGADTIQESEFIIEPNPTVATGATKYYFSVLDEFFSRRIYREQDANDCGAGAAQCTYPSIVTAKNTGNFMRHGNWFDETSTEQSFFWAN